MIGLVKLHDRIADFGAEQVILVRDDASKTKLQKKIGEMALVLTILESKGMEFDDVLVYDFFSGSSLRSGYRCLRLLARGNRNLFDSQKHAVSYIFLLCHCKITDSFLNRPYLLSSRHVPST